MRSAQRDVMGQHVVQGLPVHQHARAAVAGEHHRRARQAVVVAGHRVAVGAGGGHGQQVATDVDLPDDLGDGDLLAVAATGAYGYAMSSNYNRLPRPAMVLAGDGKSRLLVRRETLDDVLSHDVALS